MYYTNASCPVCGQVFKDDDDVVVCPDCGTPHHRHCYQQSGHCYNLALHAQGFEWESPAEAVPQDQAGPQAPQFTYRQSDNPAAQDLYYGRYGQDNTYQESRTGNRCMFCGYEIAEDAHFCNICGRPVIKGEIDGIPVEDWGRYLGRTAAPVLAAFKSQDTRHRKTALYLPLMIVPEVFLLHRRLWLEFLAYELLGSLLAIPAMVVYASEIGIASFAPLTAVLSISTWTRLMMVATVLLIALRIILAIYGLWYYRRRSGKRIRKIRDISSDEEDYSARLIRSQPTMIPVYILLGLYVIYIFSSM